ncbi:MAG: hypothetical protein ACRDYA_13610 [Egibacteraceae bacterium]
MTDGAGWVALLGLGAFHGLNPGMGWLFAVALGLVQRDRGAVLRALPPIALGHAASVGAVVALLGAAGTVVAPRALALAAAACLVGYGSWLLVRRRHLRWVGMRLRPRELVAWSFLMSTAHGAGLMLVPVLLRSTTGQLHAAQPTTTLALIGAGVGRSGLVAVAVHTAGMFAMMAAVALLVYDHLGVGVLRRSWINLDRLWASALVAAGLLTIFT